MVTGIISNDYNMFTVLSISNDYTMLQAYPSLKPLASWVIDLASRMDFMNSWINDGIPSVSITTQQ